MAINTHAGQRTKTALAQELGVSRSSLYYQLKLPAKDLALQCQLQQVMAEHPAYGHKRIALHLKMNKKRVLRVMKQSGLQPKRLRKKPVKQQDIGQTPMAIANLLLAVTISFPHQVWASDFTCLPYYGKWLYLATVEDVFTRQVLGWMVCTRHTTNLVTETLLLTLSKYPAPEIFHSDQGSEYRSDEFLGLLAQSGIKASMSAKASPWQNGKQESFYSHFKLEFGHPEAYTTIGELIEAIARQIHYYNTQRIHTALKCPPATFAVRYQINLLPQTKAKRQSV